jgi:MFS family permease
MLLVPVGTALLFPATSALLSQRCPKGELGQVLGVQQAFGGMARIFGPIWSGAAFERLGPAVPFEVASLVVLGVSVLTARVRPDPGPAEAAGRSEPASGGERPSEERGRTDESGERGAAGVGFPRH